MNTTFYNDDYYKMKNALGSNPSTKENSINAYYKENGYHVVIYIGPAI